VLGRIISSLDRRWTNFTAPWVVKQFHKLIYTYRAQSTWQDTRWLGAKVLKIPFDLWVYQEILFETKPDVIIETGTFDGGSTYFYASIFDLLGAGEVISIDVDPHSGRPEHARITYIKGSSTDAALVYDVKEKVKGKRVMVVLDSDHSEKHVREELSIWSEIVSPGCYLVIEDTNVYGHPVNKEHGRGPMEAVKDWEKANPPFKNDPTREKYMVSFQPHGYWKRY
jgi:cephalosporin hydroxylase